MFIAALFTIARTWKQSRCPSANEWIRKPWYIYTMKYYSAVKKNAFESVLMRWMKLEPVVFPGGSDGKASACNAGDPGSVPGSGRSPGEGYGNPLQFLPGKSHGQRSLADYSPWVLKGWT